MHYLAPFPIIIGVAGVLVGFIWLVAAGSDKDGGPSTGLFFAFGMLYIWLRVFKQLMSEPMEVLPAFGFIVGGGLLIWLGVVMV